MVVKSAKQQNSSYLDNNFVIDTHIKESNICITSKTFNFF